MTGLGRPFSEEQMELKDRPNSRPWAEEGKVGDSGTPSSCVLEPLQKGQLIRDLFLLKGFCWAGSVGRKKSRRRRVVWDIIKSLSLSNGWWIQRKARPGNQTVWFTQLQNCRLRNCFVMFTLVRLIQQAQMEDLLIMQDNWEMKTIPPTLWFCSLHFGPIIKPFKTFYSMKQRKHSESQRTWASLFTHAGVFKNLCVECGFVSVRSRFWAQSHNACLCSSECFCILHVHWSVYK